MNIEEPLLNKAISTLCSQIERDNQPLTVSPGLLWYNYTQYQITGKADYAQRALYQVGAIVNRRLIEDYASSVLLLVDELALDRMLAQEVEAYKDYLLSCTEEWLAVPTWDGLYRVTEVGYYLAHQRVASEQYAQWFALYTTRHSANNFFQAYANAEPVFLLGVEGVTGILLMLEAIARLTKEAFFVEVLRSGVDYLLGFRQEVDFSAQQYAVFPRLANVANQKSPWSNLLGWSGSDLMQALLLYRAADLLQDGSLRKTADLVGLNTLLRKETAVDSPNFYHGTAGIAQCYQGLYHVSQQVTYQQGCEYWTGQTVQFLSTDDNFIHGSDLLHSNLGVALTLLSYQSSIILEWKNSVLLRQRTTILTNY